MGKYFEVYVPGISESIQEVAEKLVAEVKRIPLVEKRILLYDFNGVNIWVKEKSTAQEIVEEYGKEIDKKAVYPRQIEKVKHLIESYKLVLREVPETNGNLEILRQQLVGLEAALRIFSEIPEEE